MIRALLLGLTLAITGCGGGGYECQRSHTEVEWVQLGPVWVTDSNGEKVLLHLRGEFRLTEVCDD